MSDKLNRKEIKHDRFVEDVGVAYDFARTNRNQVIALAVGAVVIALAIWGFFVYRSSRENKAQSALADAITVMETSTGTADPTSTAAPQFKSEQEKLAKAEPMFSAVAEKYSGTDASDVADLYLARIAASRGDAARAKERLQSFIRDHGDHMLAGAAQLSLYELQLQGGAGAKEVISEVEKELGKDDSPLPKDALLSMLARAYEMTGAPDKARDVYQRIVNEFPDSPYTIDAQRKLATT